MENDYIFIIIEKLLDYLFQNSKIVAEISVFHLPYHFKTRTASTKVEINEFSKVFLSINIKPPSAVLNVLHFWKRITIILIVLLC